MNQKPRTEYSIHIPYHLVHNVMHEVHQKGHCSQTGKQEHLEQETTVYLRRTNVGCPS